MNIKELIKDLDPVSIIEFKNYLLENLTKLCSEKNSNSKIISSHRHDELYCKKCGCKFKKMEKQKTEFKNIFFLVVNLPFLKLQIR